MTCYLLAFDASSEQEFWLHLEADNLEDAEREARQLVVEAALDQDAAYDYRNFSDLTVICVGEENETLLDFEECLNMHEALEHRKADALAIWTEQYEQLRDELGHWRHLHSRDQAPHAQVALLEDRLAAHVAAKP